MSKFVFLLHIFPLIIISSLLALQVSSYSSSFIAIRNGREETQTQTQSEIANAAISSSTTSTGLGDAKIRTRNVTITNDLGDGITLTIHCKSKDDDLGQHDLSFHSSFSWHFKANEFFHTTLFYCYMWWNNVYGSFDVYRSTRDNGRCADKCWWSIRKAGAFSYDQIYDRWDLMYEWQM